MLMSRRYRLETDGELGAAYEDIVGQYSQNNIL